LAVHHYVSNMEDNNRNLKSIEVHLLRIEEEVVLVMKTLAKEVDDTALLGKVTAMLGTVIRSKEEAFLSVGQEIISQRKQ
jgi:hypothetical protein